MVDLINDEDEPDKLEDTDNMEDDGTEPVSPDEPAVDDDDDDLDEDEAVLDEDDTI